MKGWNPPPPPPRITLTGNYCRLEPLSRERHAADLFSANRQSTDGRAWTYLPYGPFATVEEYSEWVEKMEKGNDPLFYVIVDHATDKAVGVASYMRIDPKNGVIEIGHLNFSPLLQRTPAATEAMYLMMKNVFELGYRRYEWKCDSLNAPSRAAAQRLGFTFEGIFRQMIVYRERNRDTAWFSILDKEWPAHEEAFRRWLDPANFDENGQQRVRLNDLNK